MSGYTTATTEDGRVYISTEDSRNLNVVTRETPIDTIPETVLQYERQMRKVAAANRASTEVSKEKHLNVIYVDEHLVVTNKPSGILCVPGIRNRKSSSLLTLVHHDYASSDIRESVDKMVVHRLDMDTSGLVVFGRTLRAVSELHKLFRDREVDKSYEALVCGHILVDNGNSAGSEVGKGGIIDLPLQRDHERPPFMRVATPQSEHNAVQVVQDLQHPGSPWKDKIKRKKPKPSRTEFTVLAHETISNNNSNKELPVTRLLLKPLTGRTHQLRVHCAALGYPIVGDPAYGIYGEASSNGGFAEHSMDALNPSRCSLQLQNEINSNWGSVMCL
eukprot:CAMPEP_0194168648 /NCGR_PEP_ID=MMETSP0154-20130528/3533_1 /TAXON_ID=1049557 /ORGANISM="Thalassiothrix antarctica, Strain L6-D1" /LENGTH=331 /DNA_ID=CAMNT_0038879827 /DNA_START=151 /DNA_END=1143 /DNA_ORIENTATION=+